MTFTKRPKKTRRRAYSPPRTRGTGYKYAPARRGGPLTPVERHERYHVRRRVVNPHCRLCTRGADYDLLEAQEIWDARKRQKGRRR